MRAPARPPARGVRAIDFDRLHDVLDVRPAVADAVAAGGPVVALESSLIAHGLPAPHNLEAAMAAEAAIRAAGAVPATIAVLDGRIRVGLATAEIERLANSPEVAKVSRRDLPRCLADGAAGATTVAATMISARAAGIAIFSTGGIGGVHRGWQTSLDVSADLPELARTDVAVVCAGAKAILDLPATLEYLETHGVPVIGFRTDAFPAFYARDSGLGVDYRLDDAPEVARHLWAKWSAGLAGGVVVANPVPAAHALDAAALDGSVRSALDAAAAGHVRGARLTPFMLERVATATQGRSLAANRALLESNAAVAGEIAVAYAALARDCGS